jgi:hypothetical protein
MSNKTLAVCGDSWFSVDVNFKGQSFGEVLSQRHGINLLSLARGGCSNFAIALQIDQAIEMNADFIIVGCTDPDRIELPIQSHDPWEKIKKYFTWSNWRDNQYVAYDKLKKLANIKYQGHSAPSYPWLTNPTVISESINNIAFHGSNSRIYKNEITENHIQALKNYMIYLYDQGIKQQYDCWILSDAVRRLYQSQIPFVVYIEPLFNHEFIADSYWINDKNKITYSEFTYNKFKKLKSGPAFHTSAEDAIIFADYMEKRLQILEFI